MQRPRYQELYTTNIHSFRKCNKAKAVEIYNFLSERSQHLKEIKG